MKVHTEDLVFLLLAMLICVSMGMDLAHSTYGNVIIDAIGALFFVACAVSQDVYVNKKEA